MVVEKVSGTLWTCECATCHETVDKGNTVLTEVVCGPYGYRRETRYCAGCWIEKGFNQTPNVIETRVGLRAPNPSRSDGPRYDGSWDNAVRAIEGT
jgi:hypothetical protein